MDWTGLDWILLRKLVLLEHLAMLIRTCVVINHAGKIESVNGAMLKSLLEEESDLVVFMFREDNRCQMGVQYYNMADKCKIMRFRDIIYFLKFNLGYFCGIGKSPENKI